jgi:hypothetical protein
MPISEVKSTPVQPLSTLRTPRRRDARKTRSRPACSALNGPDFHGQAHSSFPLAPRIRLSDKTSSLRPRHVVPKPAQAYEPEVRRGARVDTRAAFRWIADLQV